MRPLVICFFCLFSFFSYGQEEKLIDSLLLNNIDKKYLEDQFYIGVNYNVLLNRPASVSQSNLSYGLHFGFIKDIPLNEKRNIGFGIGAGYAINAYYSNLKAYKESGSILYEKIADTISFSRNKIGTHLIDVPVEFRWRTSTADSFEFWRIYAGVRFSYIFANRSKYIGEPDNLTFSNEDIRPFQYGLYTSFGYNTWNFYAQYQLSSLIENKRTTDGEQIDMNVLRLGLIFYIL